MEARHALVLVVAVFLASASCSQDDEAAHSVVDAGAEANADAHVPDGAMDVASDTMDGASDVASDAPTDATDATDSEVVDGSPSVPCDPSTTGLVQPLPTCSPATPCETPLGTVTEATTPPACDDPAWTEVASQQVDGLTRHACVYRPEGATPQSPRPLVLWFHPGGDGAVNAQETSLLAKAASFDLSGDPERPGFVLAAIHGRRLFFPTKGDRHGETHHDFYYRDLASPSSNPDIANADAWIDRFVEDEGIVDDRRIYVMGWSNGAFFGQLYAIARHETATPGGARVAAAAVFAAGDPFHSIVRNPFTDELYAGNPSCRLDTYPTSDVPILLVYRTCDLATPCGASDNDCFTGDPGYVTSDWLAHAPSVGITHITGFMIHGLESGSSTDTNATVCSDVGAVCTTASCAQDPAGVGCLCLVNHMRWPDGKYGSGSGVDREPGMLTYLRQHSLP